MEGNKTVFYIYGHRYDICIYVHVYKSICILYAYIRAHEESVKWKVIKQDSLYIYIYVYTHVFIYKNLYIY
jgi:hypothetical protein